MRFSFAAFLLLVSFNSIAQLPASLGHSHNDYEQPAPFWTAWKQRFGSVEADIFLENGELIVAHDKKQLARGRTLDSLYLQPLQQCIASNKGHVYEDTSRQLQLMIDIKSAAEPALKLLVEKLRGFPSLINCTSLKIVISGNRPDPSSFHQWPVWIRFDAVLQKEYSARELERIEMLSDNFARYSSWKGEGDLPEKERQALAVLIGKAHRLNKKIRFWNAPDDQNSWSILISMGVDYINTDRIEELGSFLRSARR